MLLSVGRLSLRLVPLSHFVALVAMLNDVSALDAQECFVHVPMFDAVGNGIPVTLREARIAGQRNVNLLNSADGGVRITSEGDLIRFPRGLIGAVIELDLQVNRRLTTRRKVTLMDCRQRTSLQHGQLDSGADVRASRLKGRLVGCSLSDEWWIRAMPLFGGHEDPASYEGFIDPSNGSFSLVASLRGERHIIVIGRNKDPVKVIAANVEVGGMNDLGTIQLSGLCP